MTSGRTWVIGCGKKVHAAFLALRLRLCAGPVQTGLKVLLEDAQSVDPLTNGHKVLFEALPDVGAGTFPLSPQFENVADLGEGQPEGLRLAEEGDTVNSAWVEGAVPALAALGIEQALVRPVPERPYVLARGLR